MRRRLCCVVIACGVLVTVCFQPVAAQRLVNALEVPGEATDKHAGAGANANRLGGFGSDLAYSAEDDCWYGLVDRGPGGGVLPYAARVQKFRLDVDRQSGRIANFQLLATITLNDESGQPLNGLNPLAQGAADRLALSFDAEGLARAGDREWFVSDEYGPSVRRCVAPPAAEVAERQRYAWTTRQVFPTPPNLVPHDETGAVNYVAEKGGQPSLAAGRAANRGLEGLSLSPSGRRLYAALQSPLVDEGPHDDGERSRWVRIVEFDASTGQPAAQWLYELESTVEINRRIADPEAHFKPAKQGRAVGISALVALDEQRLLVLERDNRGIGIDNPAGNHPVLRHTGSKRLYEIDLSAADDVSQVSLRGRDAPPAGIRPVAKRLYLDLQAELVAQGLPVPEKIEGVAFGPALAGGGRLLLVATDNDFSVTQNKSSQQFDVYADGTEGPIDGQPAGRTLLPTWLYAFQAADPVSRQTAAP